MNSLGNRVSVELNYCAAEGRRANSSMREKGTNTNHKRVRIYNQY